MDTSLAKGFRRAIPYPIAPDRARASFLFGDWLLVIGYW
jgi:hypothetical protein